MYSVYLSTSDLSVYYAPPFNEVGVYCFSHVGWSVRPSVCRPFLVRMITRHRIDVGLSDLVQTCISGV